jgi:N-methylhydantoinase B/oxoprolinase/acetone carboxylase alpha subunit
MSASLTPTKRTSVKAARSPTLLEVLKNRFQAVVDEMGFVLLRTGHTVFIKERGDFPTAFVTPRARSSAPRPASG